MGKFKVRENEIISKHVDKYLENSTSIHSRYLSGTPTFVTYYNMTASLSTSDEHLSTVVDIVGDESPNVYIKTENFPLYGIESQSLNINFDDTFGMDTEIESEATILPKTLKPYVDDYFVIPYNGNDKLYRVTNVQIDKINGDKYYKITFIYARDITEELDFQVDRERTTIFDNIGSEHSIFVDEEIAVIYNSVTSNIDKLIDFYYNSYIRANAFGVPIHKYNDKFLYNEYVCKFMKDNLVLEKINKTVRGSYYVDDLIVDRYSVLNFYEYTIYRAIETKNYSHLKYYNFYPINMPKAITMTPFFFANEPYYLCSYHMSGNSKEAIDTMHNDFMTALNDNDYVFIKDEERWMEKMILEYLKNEILDVKWLKEWNTFINNTIIVNYHREYSLLPCIIYILKKVTSDLIDKRM